MPLAPPELALLSSGAVRLGALLVMAADAAVVMRVLAKQAAIPQSAEFNGRVIEAWIHEYTGENSASYTPCFAIDDGLRDHAWVFYVSREQYARFTPGTDVHTRVNPRRNELLDLRPLETDRA